MDAEPTILMADPLSNPAFLFTPSRSSTLTPLPEPSMSSSPQIRTSKPTHPKTRFYIELPRLSSTVKALYEDVPDSLVGGSDFVRDDLDTVVGEYPPDIKSTPLHYFVRFKDGLARRISARMLKTQHQDLVDDYERRKDHDVLDDFDPYSDDVHEDSRLPAVNGASRGRTVSGSTIPDYPPSSDSPLTEEEEDEEDAHTSDDAEYSDQPRTRKSTRLAANNKKFVQSRLPFSPKKLRSKRVRRAQAVSDTGDEFGGYGQVDSDVEDTRLRRSGRSRKSARSNLTDTYIDEDESDEDEYHDSPNRKSRNAQRAKKKRPATARPAYGHFRGIEHLDFDPVGDEATLALRVHRDICEKCHKGPAHELLVKRKKGKRKSKDPEDEPDEDDEEYIRALGGWVRCLKCPVVAHWNCLAKAQREEITRAARLRDRERWKAQQGEDPASTEPSPGDLPDRRELDINETTEFICGPCMRGGICMRCLEVALEPDPSLVKQPRPIGSSPGPQNDIPVAEMADGPLPVDESLSSKPSRELLFRCFSCKRLAHYQHLRTPQDANLEDADVASYYQDETGWRCADCASYVYPLDKILAWRPYPKDVVEPTSTDPPSPKSSLPREYLVKWADRSYRRTQWVPHMWLVSTNMSKLKHFLATGSKVPLLEEPVLDETAMDLEVTPDLNKQPIFFEPSADTTPEVDGFTEPKNITLGPLPDAELRIPPAWKIIDRVLDARFLYHSSVGGKRKEKNARLPYHIREQLEQAYAEGEQPDESLMKEPDDWLSRTGDELSMDHIDQVIWVFVKWADLGYDEATWDSPPRHGEPGYAAYKRAFQYFVDSRKVFVKKTRKEVEELEAQKEKGYDVYALKRDDDEQPELGQGSQFKLMKFQIDGYNWLCDNWFNRQPSILADEMGLGKTVQIVTYLGTLIGVFKAAPALVVVPNSTITNWVREFSRWAPKLRVVPFYGEAKARDIIMRYELFHERTKNRPEPKYHVLVTTYDTITNTKDFTSAFKSVPRWEILVVDEGQRLKSDSSLLFKKLNELKPVHRVIMTGTPLNNNIRELFNLMNFLDPDQWKDLEALEKEYEELDEDLVRRLHLRLKPYFLRRIKNEVLQLPPKNEVIVPLSMSPLQKEIYRSILSQNLDILRYLTQPSTVKMGSTQISKTNMNNMLMQLRKCIQHPYLISNDIEPRGLEPREAHEKLIDASTKLRLLRSLLPKLKSRGHRVLLFSQFVIALDIIEDFLKGENYKYLRLDGSTKQALRQKGMDEFNKPDSDFFIYLLTTRAGGVGINLYTADTVIVFDPDFNPHQDLQAIARSHRYGQKKTCLVFKLVVKDSAEERIMQAGKKKLVLDHLIVQKMDDNENGGDDLKSILTFGAKALFEEGDQAAKDIVYTDNDLDKLIEKTEVEGESENTTSEPGLKFNFAKVWAAEKGTLEEIGETVPDIEQGDSWAQALERIAATKNPTEEKEVTGRGVRRRAAAIFPQQRLDFLEDLEDTPDKTKGKSKRRGHPSKSPTSDSDAYTGSVDRDGDGDSDATTGSMDVDDLPLDVALPRQPHGGYPFPPEAQPTASFQNEQKCGLCGGTHGPGSCIMTRSSSNLLEYREILVNYANDEAWEDRMAAVEAIDQVLHARGQGHMLVGLPLRPVPRSRPASVPSKARKPKRDKVQKSSSSKAPVMHDAAGGSRQPQVDHKVAVERANKPSLPPAVSSSAALPTKRPSSPGMVAEASSSKKQKHEVCPVCYGSQHPVENCPIVQEGTKSITKQIVRLSDDPSQKRTVKRLKRILKLKRKQREGIQFSEDRMQS